MKKLTDNPPISKTDKLCLALLALCFLIPHLSVLAIDSAADRAVEEDKPQPEIVSVAPPIDCAPLVEAIKEAQEAAQDDPYDDTIPLSRELQAVLREACDSNNVPLCDALGVIEVESNFRADADNGVSFGLMQLNRKYFRDDITPADNIRAGVNYLGGLLVRYDGDIAAALRAYNLGHDDGDRRYARSVLDASEKWGCG